MRERSILDFNRFMTRKDLFLAAYFVSFLGLYLSINEATPFAQIFSKLKYLYMVFCIADLLSHRKQRIELYSSICLAGLLLYYVIFGFIIRYPTAHTDIRNHDILMAYYFLLLIPTVLEVNFYRCMTDFVECTYRSLYWFILFCAATHFTQIVWNPLYFIKMLLFEVRVGSDFGFDTSNYMGNFGYVTLASSLLLLFMLKDEHRLTNRKFAHIIGCDLFVYLVMQSASSRSPSLSLIIFVCLGIYFELMLNKRLHNSKLRLALLIITIFLVPICLFLATDFGLWGYIWSHSNRSLNLSKNLPYVGVIGTKLTGMGFVENGAFQSEEYLSKLSAFGVYTSSLDMYYVYLYCTTGILGCCIMGSILVFMLILLVKNCRRQYGGLMLALYLSVLFYAFWESVIFTYRFWAMMPIFVILLCMLGNSKKKRYLTI